MISSGPVMLGSYDYGLVILSVLISMLAAFAALDLSGRVAAAWGKAKLAWLIGGATVSGIGTWSMHYTGMRAFSLPVPVQYDWLVVLLSLLPASFGFAVALFLMSRRNLGWPQVLAGGIFVGGGIAAMHFIGMASMRLQGMCHYSPFLSALSILVAMVLSVVSLWLTFVHPGPKAGRQVTKAASVLLLGAANPALHYTAMAGTLYTYSQIAPDLSHAVSISTIGLRVFAIVPLMVLTVALTTSLVDRLQKETVLLDQLFEQAPQAVALTNSDNLVLRVNGEFKQIFGYSAQETIGRRLNNLIVPEESRGEFQKHAGLEVAPGHRVDAEGIRQRKDGSRLHTSIIQVPVALPGGQTLIYALLSDITERKRAEDALRRSEDHLRLVIDTVPALIHTGRPDGYLDFFNRRWLDYVDLPLEEMSGWKWTAVIHPEDVSAMAEKWRVSLATGEPFEQEARLRRADGIYRWMIHRKVPLRDDRGNIVQWYGSSIDIEDRRRAEDDLRRQKEILQKIFDNVPAMIAFVGPDGKLELANREFQRTLGWTLEEMVAQNLETMLAEFYPDLKYRQEVMKFMANSNTEFIDLQVRVRDRRVIDTSWGKARLSDGTDIYIGRDITERKRAEEAVRDSEERYRTLFERNLAGVYRTMIDGRILECNQAMANILGFNSPEEAKVFRGQDNYFSEWERTLLIEKLEAEGHLTNFEVLRRRKDGSPVWLLANLSLVTQAPSGQRIIEGTFIDITERKRAEEELQRSRDKLRALAAHLQRIREEERTRVAREIHDELGQALTAIKIDLSSLICRLPDDGKKQSESTLRLVDETIQSVRRIATELRPVILDEFGLVAAVEWASEEFQARTSIKCRLDLPQEDFVIDPERATALFRIFQETLTNVARHANATEVSVRMFRPEGGLTLEVHDNGKGATEEQLLGGSSLGILGMRERALLLGGDLTITGAAGKGTTVIARIPQTPETLTKDGK
jgi:PAS domain S-box-containing protein